MSETTERLSLLNSPARSSSAWGFVAAIATGVLEPNLLKEGIVVHSAERTANGDHLHRYVQFFTGPLPFALRAAAAAIAALVLCAVGVGMWLQAGSGPATFGPKIPLRRPGRPARIRRFRG